MQAELDFVTPPWPKISAAAKDCVRQLLTVQVQSRPSASELLQVRMATIPVHGFQDCLHAMSDLQQLRIPTSSCINTHWYHKELSVMLF